MRNRLASLDQACASTNLLGKVWPPSLEIDADIIRVENAPTRGRVVDRDEDHYASVLGAEIERLGERSDALLVTNSKEQCEPPVVNSVRGLNDI